MEEPDFRELAQLEQEAPPEQSLGLLANAARKRRKNRFRRWQQKQEKQSVLRNAWDQGKSWMRFKGQDSEQFYSVRSGSHSTTVELDKAGIRKGLIAHQISLDAKISHESWVDPEKSNSIVWKSIREWAKEEFEIRVLYQPFRAYVVKYTDIIAPWLMLTLFVCACLASAGGILVALIYSMILWSMTSSKNWIVRQIAMTAGVVAGGLPAMIAVLLVLALWSAVAYPVGAFVGALVGLVRYRAHPRLVESI